MVQSAGDAGNASLEAILQAVQNANQTWKAGGVQFWVKSIERYVMPHFADMTPWPDGKRPWSLVKGELAGPGTPFSIAPADAWYDTQENDKQTWLTAVATVYAEQNELTVWLEDDDGHGHFCQFPNEGRCCVWNGHALTSGDVHEAAHELGHYLGLVHTFNANGHQDPSTQQPLKLSDRWDLVFKPGTSAAAPNRYYRSKSQAAADEASLQLIDTRHNCNRLDTGQVTCSIGTPSYSELRTEGDDAMKGMAFPHPDGHGDNAMSYLSPRLAPRDLSDAQIAIARKFLRWDEPFDSASHSAIYAGFTHAVTVTSGERPRLGSFAERQVAAKLDFDGDGLRDLGYWVPPAAIDGTGQFIALLSSHGYSQSAGQYLHASLGGLGDTPVPADYSGDGRTDLAVFQLGGGLSRNDLTNTAGYWRWCATASPAESTTCASPTVLHYGERYDVPAPGLDFDGSPPDGYAIYRPKNGTWYFKEPSWGSSRAVVISTPSSGAVPLPGQYDCDDRSDLAVYEPMTAKLALLRSELDWGVAQTITRQFSTSFIPQGSGTTAQMGGVVPVAGQTYWRACGGWPFPSFKPRLSAVLFFPEDGSWNMIMDPVGSATVSRCTFGRGDMMPFGGTDWNHDGQSDMALYGGAQYSGAYWTLFAKNTTWSSCTGSVTYRMDPGGAQRPCERVHGVSDMTGDGINELMIVAPDQGVIRWVTSESSYRTELSRATGSSTMEVL